MNQSSQQTSSVIPASTRFGVLRPPMPWHKPRIREGGEETVILIHGLWRSIWAMEPMAKYLNSRGYRTVNCPYASFRLTLPELVEKFLALVEEQAQLSRKIHFVTHSLGGVIVRQLLQHLDPALVGRVVMLAPPHQGSEIVDWLQSNKLHSVLGPAGEFLSTRSMAALESTLPENVPVAVIMGRYSLLPFFRKMLERDNDGIVSVGSGQVQGVNLFEVVDADHTYISSQSQVMEMTWNFLKYEELKKD